eukprot:COSAG02_NODE_2641_length_8349_cov_2.610667_5_plen_87_part_00
MDNDDGSSFYDISENIFFDADGFKMDYVSLLPVWLCRRFRIAKQATVYFLNELLCCCAAAYAVATAAATGTSTTDRTGGSWFEVLQ